MSRLVLVRTESPLALGFLSHASIVRLKYFANGLHMTSQIAISDHSSSCNICNLLTKGHVGAGVDRPWLSTEDYSAVISIGALVPGWTLLAPKRHAVNMQASYKDQKFWEFAREAAVHLSARYGSVVAFEHGPNASNSLTGCGTGHAHLHLVPLNFPLAEYSRNFDLSKQWAVSSFDEIAQKSRGGEYLFVADKFEADASTGFLSIISSPISQFFRKVIASNLGMSEFSDYRRYPMLDIVESSTLTLESSVAEQSIHVA